MAARTLVRWVMLPLALAACQWIGPAGSGAEAPRGDLNLIGSPEPAPGAMAAGVEHDRRVTTQVIEAEVRNTVERARPQMATDPEAAAHELKLTLYKVRRADLEPESRARFVEAIQSALREAARRRVEVEQARQQRQESRAAAHERDLLTTNLLRKQEKLKQLLERFDSLMDERHYQLAEEAAAGEARKIEPDNPVPLLAALNARSLDYFSNAMQLREARQKGVVDTLYQVERSHVPFPDEPPIVYPDPEVWQQLTARRREKYSSMDLAKKGSAEKKIDDALRSPTQFMFTEQPLEQVVDYLKDYHKIEIQLDKKALEDVNIGSNTPVTRNIKGISLRSALRLMLKELGLTYIIRDEVLLITTPDEADAQLLTKVYPVADLVLPIPQGGMMGGMGGIMGGMGMNGMGMGTGGMTGGMGGMGMGGMGMGGMGIGAGGGMGGGMGMFNVPRDLLPKVPPGGFQAFAVKDNVSAEKPTAGSDTSAAPSRRDTRPTKIDIDLKGSESPEAIWDRYFAKDEPRPAAVRQEVRELMHRQKFDHVIAMLGAALRHRQPQPWMYEALALALDAAGRPQSEIERAVMSAMDFADNSADLMYIGAYLSQLGLYQRALQTYRLATALDPLRPEPYMLGLRAARAADDLDGLKWASLGILGQAWPKAQADIWQAGVGVAKEVLDRLKADKRTKEAEEFKAALDEAVERDCVAVVTWTGEGDIDVLVEEPSGTVCSLQCPRTAAGGILIGDDTRQPGRDSFGGHSQAYVCPKGFDGTYRLLARRVWGDVTTGKVNVEVMTHCNTANVIDVRKWIPLNNDEALVQFDLKGGRRKQPLEDYQLCKAVYNQLTVNRQVLTQQLDGAVDPQSMANLAMARTGGVVGNELAGLFLGGAVGYQPVIVSLPEGANLGVTAVVSADRRYVRITSQPLFSGIAQVNVFNMATGANTTGQGGTNGRGFSQLNNSSSQNAFGP